MVVTLAFLICRLAVALSQPAAAAEVVAPPAAAVLHDKRVPPSYDGRPPAPPTAREGLIWVPRAVLLPAHLVAEYVLRRPIVGLVRWGDEHYLWNRIHDFFTWDEGRAGVYPIANIDLGLRPTVGANLFARQWLDPHNELRASASFADEVITASGRDRFQVFRDGTGSVYLGGSFAQRPDGVFYGTGPAVRTADKTFFSYFTDGVSLGIDGNLGGLSHAVVELSYRDARFGTGRASAGTPSIDARYGGPGQPPLPPGFEGYHLVEPRVGLVLDSRSPHFDGGAGMGGRVELAGGYGLDPRATTRQLATWSAAAAAYDDFTGAGHIVALEVGVSFVERLGSRAVPFTELASLGGTDTMRGFLGGRFRDASAITATLQYRYPFWTLLDGELFAGAGNAFPGHLQGLAPASLFASYGLALRTTFARDSAVGLTIGFGSTRFDDPSFRLLDTTRVALGVNHGF